jgi:hypothetical protein
MTSFPQLRKKNLFRSWQHLTVSLLVGLSAGFFGYILAFQTPVFSRRYLLLGLVSAAAGVFATCFLLKWHPFADKNHYFINRQSLGLAGLLVLLALPSWFLLPPYPELPFFQRQSSLVITLQTGSDPLSWSQFRKLYLNSGAEKLGARSFQISASWIAHGDDFVLPPETSGQILWQGRVGKRASVSIPIPAQALKLTTDWDGEVRGAATDKSPYVRNKNFVAPAWYIALIYGLAWIPFFFAIVLMEGFPLARRVGLPLLVLFLAVVQVNLQFERLGAEFHQPVQDSIDTIQLPRHFAVLNGTAPNPWQYRVLSEWIVEAAIRGANFFKLENPIWEALWGLRVLQNLILLMLAYLYYVRLGITKTGSIYGMFLLAGGMLHVFYQSDLSFNTYFDLIFYLLAGILILEERYAWLPVLMVAAALNRETALAIPVLALAWGWRGNPDRRKQAWVYGGAAFVIGLAVYAGLHVYYPEAPIYLFGDVLPPGWGLFRYNLTVRETPLLLFQTLGFLPLVVFITYKHWHPFLRICFLLLAPVWLFVHAFASNWTETRLFLVLLAMFLIPAALPLIEQRLQEVRRTAEEPPEVIDPE